MGEPEFRTDETVLLRTPGIYVKSIPFEGILTTRRIILVDRAKNLLPPKEIPLATIRSADVGENAIRDQILTLSVMAKTGDTRQMILTFSRQEGGNRIKERDEWFRQIKANMDASFETVIRKVIPGADAAPRRAEPVLHSRVSVVSSPVQPAPARQEPVPVKRETEYVPPVKKFPEPAPSPAVQQFDASALGQDVFCTRCGNKAPSDSAFCNRCGATIVRPSGVQAPAQSEAPPQFPQQAAAPVSPPVSTRRPIDREIQTIEPLIERSTEKIPVDPLRKPVSDVVLRQAAAWDDAPVAEEPATPPKSGEPEPAAPVAAEPVATPAADTAAPSSRGGFLPKLFSGNAPSPSPEPVTVPSAAPPVPPKRGRSFTPGRNVLMGIGAVIIILIVVAVSAVFVLPMLSSGGLSLPSSGNPTPQPTSTSSSVLTKGTVIVTPTPAKIVPADGVYVHVNYLGGFKGQYGMTDMMTTVPGNSGERVWAVENASGTVIAEFEKLDGSSHELLVEIYKDGTTLSSDSTKIGHGSVKLSADVGAAAIPAATPTSGNTTPARTTAAVTTTVTTKVTTATPATTTAAATTTTVAP